ncbi:MAG: HYR domain-containing protein, partial [Gemmatimonadota bacterium]|nr:HYR domain-containing protein [Gemmatimonadota bacterium]
VAIVSCSDNMAPKTDSGLDPNSIHLISVPAAEKEAYYASLAESPEMSGNVVWSAPARAVADVAATAGSCSSGGTAAAYTLAATSFAPESDPVNAVPLPRDGDDGYVADMPIGFDFNFYGNTYNKLNLYLNGFVTFGTPVAKPFWSTDGIPVATTPNNMISVAWTDWYPGKVPGSLRYETRGTAPNRRFLIQFRGVPEVQGTGKLTALLVLSEGTNDIAIYTTQFNMTYIGHRMTQGIENVDGTVADFGTALTPAGLVTPRVRGVFSLANDALRFSPLRVRDEVPPSITAPASITAGNDPGLASAVVAVGAPETLDDCTPVTVSSLRSDGASIDAPYPVGVTTITWTAKDEAGNAASAIQTVTVLDIEAPVFAASTPSILEVNATSPSGATVAYTLRVTDNVGVTSVSCEPASGSLFKVGSTPVSCTASDAAGNASSRAFSVNVIGAHEQLFNLLEYVIELGLPNGTAQPLINQLRASYNQESTAAACTKMGDFLTMLEKKGSSLSSAEVQIMIAEGTRIMDAMGCVSPIQASLSAQGDPRF